jgi:hypothetical protein
VMYAPHVFFVPPKRRSVRLIWEGEDKRFTYMIHGIGIGDDVSTE